MDASDVLMNAAGGAVVALIGTWVISVVRATKLLDEEAQSCILGQNSRIIELEKKPKRTPAEQHHYEIALEAIKKHGERGKSVLRHLRNYGELVYGFTGPQPPPGMNGNELKSVLSELTGSHVVTMSERRSGSTTESVFRLAPGVQSAMDELLYRNNSDNSQT